MNQLDLFTWNKHWAYFNTTSKKGEELEKARVKAGSETERILTFFRSHPNESFAPFEVEARLFPSAGSRHITNTRRSISTLTPEYLTKTDEKRKDPVTGEGAFCWKLKQTI